MRFKFIILCFLVFLAPFIAPLCAKAYATDYYFDSINGNDSNTGITTTSAWKSLSKMNITTYSAGDGINLKRNSSWTGTLIIKQSGISGNPITVQSYGTGSKPAFSNSLSGSDGIDVNASWIILDGVFITDTPLYGIKIAANSNHNIIRNIEVTKTGEGVLINGSFNLITTSYFHDLVMITNSQTPTDDDYGAVGVVIANTDNEVSYNTMKNCRAPSYDYGTDGGVVEFWRDVSRANVHHNISSNDDVFIEAGSDNNANITNVVIADNVSTNDRSFFGAHFGGTFSLTAQNINIENNTIVETQSQHDMTIFWAWPNQAAANTVFIRNNIVYSNENIGTTNFTHDHNLYYLTGEASLGFIPDTSEIQADPLFVNIFQGDYHLTSGSPARNKGIHVPLSTDYEGNVLPQIPDLGAYKYILPSPSSTVSVIAPTSTPQPSLYWGAWMDGDVYGTQDAPWDQTTWNTFEHDAGKKVSIVHFGQPSPWLQPFAASPLNLAVARGAIPFIDMNTQSVPLTDISNGIYDSSIITWAQAAKNWGKPFFLRWNWEMNGTWFDWGAQAKSNPANYVAAWKHIHDLVTTQGATSVTWVWCPNIESTGFTSLESLYPGDQYVDWTCIDGYNKGTNPLQVSEWKSFHQIFQATYDHVLQIAPSKPIMLGETASTEIGGNKAAWITDAVSTQIPNNYPHIKAVVWFNWNINENGGIWDWPIESSANAESAFAQAIANPLYATNSFTTLPPGKIQPLSLTQPADDADANSDGQIDGIDYVIWLNHYGQSTIAGKTDGNFNNDSKVDGLDYVIWLNNYGQ